MRPPIRAEQCSALRSATRFCGSWLVLGWLAFSFRAHAANIIAADVTATLGTNFFFDTAVTGGNDHDATVFTRDISGYWASNSTVTLRGLGWASSASGTAATKARVTFTDLGADNVSGGGDDTVVGIVTDNLTFSGASEYAWSFNSNLVFTASGNALRLVIEGLDNANSPSNIRRKTTSGSTSAAVKLSLAGTATSAPPPPNNSATAVATTTGFWEQVSWLTSTGAVTGGLATNLAARIGGDRTVTFRGLPVAQSIAELRCGTNGRGTLEISSGTLNVTGPAQVGLDAGPNDGFLKILGGTLNIGGSVNLGRSADSCDGTIELASGAVNITGDLNAGAFLQGAGLLRFQNPGASPAIAVGGKLLLARAALALTFTTNYLHTPGSTIDLVSYATREGQFGNFRNGDEFNSGANRFRIAYDVDAGGGRKKITLTSLTNWPSSGGPNIILLFADDQGSADLRLYGDNRFPMPRLESLAAQGLRFTDAYVCGGVCHPSRSGLLTGRYQQRFGADNNLSGPSYNGLPVSQRTVPGTLQGLGYRTYGLAKWHLGDTAEYHPLQRGFDRWYGINAGSRSYWSTTGEDATFQNDETPRPQDEGDYVTDRIGNACTNLIAEHLATQGTNQPFFIYCAFTAVHGPVDIASPPAPKPTDPRYARLQNEFGLTNGNYGPPAVVFSGSTAATTQKNRYDLAAMTLALDENIGKIVDMVNVSGIASNTLIVYLNDNGGAGWSAAYSGNFSYNLPLRGYKGGSMTDGSIRIPAVANWPGVIPPAQTNATPVMSLDFMATFVNAGKNVSPTARNGLDGLDLLPLMRSGTALPTNRVLCWRASGSAARMGQWKLLGDDTTQIYSLYNLATDIGETTDVSGANPAVFSELKERFRAWDAANIEPFYGSADMVVDAGLERGGITSGYRLVNRSATPAYLSASLRTALPLTTNFNLGFYLRATETNFPAGSQLWFVLGDSTTRGNFIRAGVDFASGQLRLVEGRGGASATAALPVLPTKFEAGVLKYTAATRQLVFTLGGTNVSVTLPGAYGTLGTYGGGAAAMEGEITQPFQNATLPPPIAASQIKMDGAQFGFQSRNTADAVFGPKVARSLFAAGPFAADEKALVENYGGGVYRVLTPTQTGQSAEFFRVGFNQP